MLGFTLAPAPGLGDHLIFTSFPENYYKTTGRKVIDIDKHWVFDHNPYVIRDEVPTKIVNLWTQDTSPGRVAAVLQKPTYNSISERTCIFNNLKEYLRHPRLYMYEDIVATKHRVTIHTTGVTQGCMTGDVIDHIKRKYAGWEICQVGGKTDLGANVVDCRGIGWWDTTKVIAESRVFIGVDSGISWIAASYPEIYRKKILAQFSRAEDIRQVVPMHVGLPAYQWYEGFTYYNMLEQDAGFTYSYLKV